MVLQQIFDTSDIDPSDFVRLAVERLRARTDDPDIQVVIKALKLSAAGVMPVGTRAEYDSRPGRRSGRIVAHETALTLYTAPVIRFDDDGETRSINQDVLRTLS